MEKEKRKVGRPKKEFSTFKTTKEEIEFCQRCPHKTCEKGVCDELRAFLRGTKK